MHENMQACRTGTELVEMYGSPEHLHTYRLAELDLNARWMSATRVHHVYQGLTRLSGETRGAFHALVARTIPKLAALQSVHCVLRAPSQ
jgi:hypothetical protein